MITKEELVREMEEYGELKSPAIKRAFLKVPREAFIGEGLEHQAYMNQPFPLFGGQTTSQPSMIAIMLESLGLEKGMKVLEVGSGSGYVVALLQEIVGPEVYGIERIPELVRESRKTLGSLGYKANIFEGDGKKGLPEFAPYDRIIVSASAESIPEDLLEQLKPEGKMAIPLEEGEQDVLYVVDRSGKKRRVTECMFVPLV